jgi:aspartate/methionine/tyrosine aminotransferase
VPSGGSSALIATFCMWLMLAGATEVHYLPPIYYKFAFLFQRFGIRPLPVSDAHAFQPELDLRLPERRTVLVLTDPVWYAGRRVPRAVIDEIRRWQERTGSLVFVDGSFQYMRWDGGRSERSSTLVGEQTLRMVSPTKYLSLHGYRCAYLLVPSALRDELADLHLNVHGDVPLSDRLFSHRVCDVMASAGNGELVARMRGAYARLVESGALGEHLEVETGYFAFGRIRRRHEDFLCLYAPSFELDGHRDYVRVNLLNTAALDALLACG